MTATEPRTLQSGNLGNANAVRARMHSVLSRLGGTSSTAIAGRAQLRAAISKEPGTDPAIWAYTLEDGPERLLGNEATRGERALHVALTLWALHQGSHPSSMHSTGSGSESIGSAVRRFAMLNGAEHPEEHPIYKRFSAMIAASTFDALAVHARGIVTLLSSSDIPMDYARFAADLFNWQNPELRSRIVRQWGRDFAKIPRGEDPGSESA